MPFSKHAYYKRIGHTPSSQHAGTEPFDSSEYALQAFLRGASATFSESQETRCSLSQHIIFRHAMCCRTPCEYAAVYMASFSRAGMILQAFLAYSLLLLPTPGH